MKDLRLSPEALTGIFQGRISSWNDPLIQADNPDVKMPPKQVKAVARADNSAATWWLTSWLTTAAADAWKAGGDGFPSSATTTFPAGRGIILVTGTDNVAKYVRTFPGEQSTDNTDVPFAGFIGYVYYSEAIKLGLPVVAVKNAGGGYVRPTLEGVTAGFNAGAVESGGTFAPNFHSTDQAAYPLPVASYLVAASGDSKGVIAKTAETIGKFLMYATGPGQQAATTRGYVPLTAAMKSAADTNAAKIAAKPASSIAPSSAAASTAPVAPLDPQVLAAAATLGTDGSPPTQAGAEGASVASPAPVGAPTQPASAYSGSTSSTTAPADAAQAGPLAPAKKAIETVSRAVEGVIGVGSIGSVPIGLPVLALGAACALLLGRLLLSVSRRRVLGETTIGERSDATAVIVTDVGELVHSIRVER
jgi:ABC-type phosphate transport system substrate-binding protein